jgi:hypothetical protein
MLIKEIKTMKIYRVINKQGYFIRDDFTFDELTEIGLDVEASQGLYKPQWNFELECWFESASQEYIDSLKQPIVEDLGIEQRLANVEIDVVDVKEVLDVLFGG